MGRYNLDRDPFGDFGAREPTRDLVDPDDFCRACRGKGSTTDYDYERGTTLTEPCDRCRGTGRRTILVTT